MVVNTPSGPATPGPTATRSGPPRPAMDKPIITTVQQLARGGAGHRGADDRGDPGQVAAGPRPRPRPVLPQGRSLVSVDGRGRARGRVPQVAGELIATRRVGAYQHLTLVAPGVAELARPGPVRGAGRRRRHLRHPAAPLLLDPQGQPVGHLRRHRRHRRRRARAGHPVADRRCAPHDDGRRRRPARPAVPAARPSRCRASWSAAATAARRCSGSPRRCASGAATSRWCSARRARTGCSASSRPGARPTASRSPPTTARWARAAGSPTCCRDVIRRTGAGVVYGCGPMAMLQLDHPGRRGRGRRRAGRGRGVDGLRRRGLHDLRDAGRRRRRRGPAWSAPASRARSSAATGCAGTRSSRAGAGSRTTPSAHRGPEATDEHRTRRDGDARRATRWRRRST